MADNVDRYSVRLEQASPRLVNHLPGKVPSSFSDSDACTSGLKNQNSDSKNGETINEQPKPKRGTNGIGGTTGLRHIRREIENSEEALLA